MRKRNNIQLIIGALLLSFVYFYPPVIPTANASSLSVSPATGTFTVGSTFDVSIFLDTENTPVNALDIGISFPPDELQLVSPSTGKSVIGVWTAQPVINNQVGKITFQGGIPGGINVSSGLVTTLTFRVKSVGTAAIKFSDNSRVLLHDGKGTNDLNSTNSGVYNLTLPPPAGPIVSSETHPQQNIWYQNTNLLLTWAGESKVEGYSYIFSDEPIDTPDDIVDSNKNSITYRNVADGTHYFHIKAFSNGGWGGVTHFAVKIDSSPPAEFEINVIPSTRTVRNQPIFEFQTTDALSGIDHYESKLIALNQKQEKGNQNLFVETTSPYIPSALQLGDYDFIVRSYDLAGNYREHTQRISVVTWAFEFVSSDGFQLSNVLIPWKWFWLLLATIVILLWYFGRRLRKLHYTVAELHNSKELPDHIQDRLEELNRYREKYGKILGVFLLSILISFLGVQHVKAEGSELSPPYLTTISSRISNQEIFYVGGKTDSIQSEVILHLQNLQTGETYSYEIASDKKGDWFYRHNQFLPSGKYIVWAQTKITDQTSAPSPQQEIVVTATALQFGSTRLSYEFIYLILLVIAIIIIFALLFYNLFHFRNYRKKQKNVSNEIHKAEESLKRGFAIIKRDIQAELDTVHKIKLKGPLSTEVIEKEKQLLKDLSEVEDFVGQEIWELEKLQN